MEKFRFSSIIKDLAIPSSLFMIFLSADSYKTIVGIKNGGSEGDFIVVWLWNILGNFKWALPFIWYIAAISIAFIFYRFFGEKLSLVWIYSVAFGHFLGFLSWTRFDFMNRFSANIGQSNPTLLIFIMAFVIGIFSATIHLLLKNKI
jgi:hypothetical protein